ncbi:MAG: M28 family peptidase, partial [Thermoplasmata archaeon]
AMEAARVLSNYKFNATIIFAGWTAEEIGLVGSEYYAEDARENGMDVGMVLQFDMVGYDPIGALGLNILANSPSAWILNEFLTANVDYSIGLNLTDYITSGAGGSDHYSFWQQGYQAMMGIESIFNTPNYHRTTDTIDKLNMDLVTKTTQVAVAVLAKIAGLHVPGVGAIYLNKTSYMLSDEIGISLYDTDLNANPSIPEVVDVVVNSTSEPVGEVVQLVETGSDTDVFTGTIATTPLPGVPGFLTVSHGDMITATYVEASPPGLRQANATADGFPPVIRNVAAFPDVTSAMITWDTDEMAESEVSYGLTQALGYAEADGSFVKQHRIVLSSLSPDTRYYFEVSSTDIAGNHLVDDNGGEKYSFVTLPGYTKIPRYGYVGWVRDDDDPPRNHFTDPEILVGHSNRRRPTMNVTYLGAAQFPTDPMPPSASITHAKVEFYGNRWIYDDSISEWNLKLLDSSIDAGWVNHVFSDIDNAVVEATIPPTFSNSDLVARKWNTFEFLPSQFGLLDTHLSSGRISFRLDGPRPPDTMDGVIFSWRSGYEDGISFATPYAPKLTITYSMTGDFSGPLVTSIDVNPNPTEGNPLANLSATISDVTTGGSDILAAEYFVDVDPGVGKGTPMRAIDGSLDSVTEGVDFLIDVEKIPEGPYSLYVRGMDSAGNWGPAQSIVLTVTKSDTTPPQPVSNVTASLEGLSLENLNISWALSPDDSFDVANYALYRGSTYDTDGQGYEFIANLTVGSSYYLDPNAGHGDLSNYFYFVCANDSVGNCGMSESQAGKIILNLTKGEQLISVPFYQTDEEFWKDMSTGSYSAIRAYDPSFSGSRWRSFAPYRNARTLSTVDYSVGMWVNITSDSIFTLAGSVRPQFTIQLKKGWNLVGFPSPSPRLVSDALAGVSYFSIEGYDSSAPPFYLRKYASNEFLYPGRGYWIEASSDSIWTIEN